MTRFLTEINSIRYLEMQFYLFENMDIQTNFGSVSIFPNAHPYSDLHIISMLALHGHMLFFLNSSYK